MAEFDDRGATMPHDSLSRPVVPTERVVARIRGNARALFWPSLLFIVLPGATIYATSLFGEQWLQIAIIAAAVLVFVLLVLLPYIFWLNRRCTVTSRRVIWRKGFFVRERREIFHSRGYHVALRRTWLQSAFRSGDIVITSGVEKPLVLKDLPRADRVLDTLQDLIEKNQVVLTPQAGSVGATPTGL